MSEYISLIKLVKKGKKLSHVEGLHDILVKQISEVYSEKIDRELNFISLYYGLSEKALTLESIGQSQEVKLTRERVRQIIDLIVKTQMTKQTNSIKFNIYELSKSNFITILGKERNFLRAEELLENSFFAGFKKNIKGLISFLNDCSVKQIAYRKKYYFYLDGTSRKNVIQLIQKENKNIRREKTVEKMSLKSKTVTYVPNEVREHLLNYSEVNNINLNPLYENILIQYIEQKPYSQPDYVFSRTKSWKARKGKAQWKQIGIYIEKDIFEKIQANVKNIKKELQKNVSLMSFICQAFIWHYENNLK